jgi:hypothetical protein
VITFTFKTEREFEMYICGIAVGMRLSNDFIKDINLEHDDNGVWKINADSYSVLFFPDNEGNIETDKLRAYLEDLYYAYNGGGIEGDEGNDA